MSAAKVTFEPLDLPLQNPFGISRRTTTVARNVLVRVELDGLVGLGEAAPNAYYGESQESVLAWLPRLAEALPDDPFAIHRAVAALEHAAHHNPAARAGLELALWDLVGKRYNAPIWRLWGIDERVPLSSFTIGIDTPERMGEKARDAAEYPLLKVKVGTADDVARGEVLLARRIFGHEAVAFAVGQIAALAAGALRNQNARAIDPGRVELDEFHVLQREPGAQYHRVTVTGAGVRRGAGEIHATVAAGGEHRELCPEPM